MDEWKSNISSQIPASRFLQPGFSNYDVQACLVSQDTPPTRDNSKFTQLSDWIYNQDAGYRSSLYRASTPSVDTYPGISYLDSNIKRKRHVHFDDDSNYLPSFPSSIDKFGISQSRLDSSNTSMWKSFKSFMKPSKPGSLPKLFNEESNINSKFNRSDYSSPLGTNKNDQLNYVLFPIFGKQNKLQRKLRMKNEMSRKTQTSLFKIRKHSAKTQTKRRKRKMLEISTMTESAHNCPSKATMTFFMNDQPKLASTYDMHRSYLHPSQASVFPTLKRTHSNETKNCKKMPKYYNDGSSKTKRKTTDDGECLRRYNPQGPYMLLERALGDHFFVQKREKSLYEGKHSDREQSSKSSRSEPLRPEPAVNNCSIIVRVICHELQFVFGAIFCLFKNIWEPIRYLFGEHIDEPLIWWAGRCRFPSIPSSNNPYEY